MMVLLSVPWGETLGEIERKCITFFKHLMAAEPEMTRLLSDQCDHPSVPRMLKVGFGRGTTGSGFGALLSICTKSLRSCSNFFFFKNIFCLASVVLRAHA